MRADRPQYENILKIFDAFSSSHHLWEIWQDCITAIACAISNAFDKRFFDDREKLYKDTVSKYNEADRLRFSEIFAEIVNQIDANPEQDFLGDLYMQLDLGSHWHGQFFTPYDICRLMADVTVTEEFNVEHMRVIPINDCACGGGATIIAGAHEIRRRLEKIGLNYQDYVVCYAQDLSFVAGMMCYIQLSLQGLAGVIKIADTLSDPLVDTDNGPDIWYTPMWFSPVWEMRRRARTIVKFMKNCEEVKQS